MELEIKVLKAISAVEELLAALKAKPTADARQLAIARTKFESAFLWAANADGKGQILNA